MRQWFRRRIYHPLLDLLKQGITPEKLAWSIAFGCAMGIMPFLGVTTLLCVVIALVLRLNPVAIQIANYAMYPLQLLLFIPFVRLGEAMFRQPRSAITFERMQYIFHANLREGIRLFWGEVWHAVVAWVVVVPFVVGILYILLVPPLRIASRELGKGRGLGPPSPR